MIDVNIMRLEHEHFEPENIESQDRIFLNIKRLDSNNIESQEAVAMLKGAGK